MEGDFGIGDEGYLIEAIRKDKRITQSSDDEIIDCMADALMDKGASDPEQCLDRLSSQ